ncbi:MAG: outer membrane lipoprotein-sorting protein [Pseudomonadota bacterium]
MRNPLFCLFAVVAFALPEASATTCEPTPVSVASPEAIVTHFDSARLNEGSSETVIELTTVRSSGDRTQSFKILDSGDGATLVEFLDPRQRGNRVLSRDNKIWFYAPRTRRAIRVPAIQRVFGEASYGDLTQLLLSKEYSPSGPVCAGQINGTTAVRVELEARDEASTYAKVDLWVEPDDWLPVQVDYYVASGKHIKSARFPNVQEIDEIVVLGTWHLYSPDDPEAVTRIETVSFEQVELSARRFTRRALESGR